MAQKRSFKIKQREITAYMAEHPEFMARLKAIWERDEVQEAVADFLTITGRPAIKTAGTDAIAVIQEAYNTVGHTFHPEEMAAGLKLSEVDALTQLAKQAGLMA